MINNSEIIYEKTCRFDGTGIIFYAEGRVFRAISAKAKEEVLDFLNSDLCKHLISKGLLVNTWITNDVSLPGYPLILEHEHLFCSRIKHWSFEMIKSVSIAAARLNEICIEYGYCIIDPHIGNFAISDGRIVFYDFGSFVKYDKETLITSNRYIAISNFLPLMLFSKHSGYLTFYDNSFFPKEPFSNSPVLLPLLRKVIKKYDVYHHYNSWHLISRCGFLFKLVPTINDIVRKYYRKAETKSLFKRRLIFKQLSPAFFEKIHNPYEDISNLFPIEDSRILQCAAKLKNENGISFKNILCIGNFDFSELTKLQEIRDVRINVLSEDTLYIDTLCKTLLQHPCKVNPICVDIVSLYVRDRIQSQYCGDLLIIQDQFDFLTKGAVAPISSIIIPYTVVSVAAAIKAYCNSFLLIPQDASLELKDYISSEFQKKTTVSYEGREYVLFERKCLFRD